MSTGFSLEDMTRCGFDAEALRVAGLSATELKTHLGMNPRELRDGGYSLAEIKAAKFHAWQMKSLHS